MELLTKLGDAASMFWQALDERERMLITYAFLAACFLVADGARRQRERRLVDRLREEVLAGAR